ncbi:MAG: thiol:disulfide interchange protein, partial [Burkholderiaceae bacterium]|nr:thiol:disulfide interchange protein [Burkholderiaceae bacterium]
MQFLSVLAFIISLVAAAPAAGQSLPRFGAPEKHVDAELIAATDSIVPGQPLTVGLRLKHEDEWHTYWLVPGDSGLPTQIKWQLPAGFSASQIDWPHPKRLPVGPLMNFGYEGETLLLTTLQVPADLPVGTPITLNAKASWLECKDVCIPGDAQVKLTLPVKPQSSPSASAALFKASQARVPQSALAASAT